MGHTFCEFYGLIVHVLDFLDFLMNCRSGEFKLGVVGTVIGDSV